MTTTPTYYYLATGFAIITMLQGRRHSLILSDNLAVRSITKRENLSLKASSSITNEDKGNDDAEDVQPMAEYGVSYIGGDPCGSKYNDDPFDAQIQKPGMPDDMKARIQALVDKKVAEEEKAAASAAEAAGEDSKKQQQ